MNPITTMSLPRCAGRCNPMASSINQGYLLLADISGFSAFLQDNEIDHSAKILHDLILVIMERLNPVMAIAEVEGDAVFAYAPEQKVTRGELLLEIIESTYAAFRDRRKTMEHNATCPCSACESISSLDLKFIVHHGDYVLQEVSGRPKPMGSSVNAAHRLLKNNFTEASGWRAYALLSEQCLAKIGVNFFDGLHFITESYPDVGEFRAGGIDLDERYRQMLLNRTVFLTPTEADFSMPFTFAASQPVVWDWLTDPAKRNRWSNGSAWSAAGRPQGRTGPSALNHCSSSGATEEILDWRPFDYYTVHLSKGRFKMLITSVLEPVEDGTCVLWHMRFNSWLPAWIRRYITRRVATRLLRLEENFKKMSELMAA